MSEVPVSSTVFPEGLSSLKQRKSIQIKEQKVMEQDGRLLSSLSLLGQQQTFFQEGSVRVQIPPT